MAEVPPFLWADAGSFPSPVVYTVPGSGEVQPYTATATYVNASGQAILPALRLKSDSGNLLSLTFPVGQTIADGGSSEVTFVPPFGSAQGSSTPTATATDFGPSSWYVPLINFHGAADVLSSASVDFVYDSAATSGGYVTRATPLQNSFFALVVALHPQSSIWGFTFTRYGGPDYGIISVDIASIGYQLGSRSSGNPAGKVQDIQRSGTSIVANYGANPSFLNLVTLDAYSAGAIGETNYPGTITFIPGGAEGATLTNLSASTDPYTGLSISDGGPGWYCLRFQVKTKNAASSNYRFRIPMVSVLRVPDGDGF